MLLLFSGVSRQPNLDDPIYSSSNASFIARVRPYVNNLQDYLKSKSTKIITENLIL